MITALLVAVAILAGVMASIVGFGVGSLLTPALSLQAGIKLAVAAIALLVDAARLPVYLWTEGARMLEIWPIIASITAGVVIGTLVGRRLLDRIPEKVFRRTVGAVVLLLGLYMLCRAFSL